MTEITDAQIERLRQQHFPDGVPHEFVSIDAADHDYICRRCLMVGNMIDPVEVRDERDASPCPAWRPDLRIEDAMMLVDHLVRSGLDVIIRLGTYLAEHPCHVEVWYVCGEGCPQLLTEKRADTAMAITLAAIAKLESLPKEEQK